MLLHNGNLDCFYLLATMNSTLMNMYIAISVPVFNFWCACMRVYVHNCWAKWYFRVKPAYIHLHRW